ncbi:hypothetical protein [Lentibacillus sp. CBA3610]|nr:hypothetical protein [Lentibacillus sp. CBA3610]
MQACPEKKIYFEPMFESILKDEMNHHISYESNNKVEKETLTYT